MKRALLSLPFAAAILLTACETVQTAEAPAATQQADADTPAPRVTAGHGKNSFLAAYDTDGQVSLAEFMAEREKGYNRRDADGDGAVHEEEYVSEYEARLEQELKDRHDRQIKQAYVRFDVLDTDKDDNITLTEFNASGSRMFEDLDTNGDGIVNDEDTAEAY